MGGALSSAPTEAAQAAVISEPALVSADVPDFPDSAAVTLAPSRNRGLPYLVTQGGAILKPDAAGAWDVLPLDAHVNDLFVDFDGSLWAATDSGTYQLRIDSSEWELADPIPSKNMISTHGYMFMLGAGEISRGDPINPDHWRLLDVPYIDQPAADLVMLGTHTHVLQNGGALFHSPDLGLGWRPLDAAGPVSAIWTDIDGNLLAATSDGIDLWDRITNDWRDYAPLPDGQIVSELRTFNDRLFAVSEGYLYRYTSGTWMLVGLPESTDAYLTALEVQYPDTLWALDAVRSRLWSSADGSTWTLHRVPIG
ncbi:MAG: hypothetical protein H7175_11675, partial [Burkholderiales bacterium]|nr:hypothetical protein [Anaerolineae bacterium]